MQVITTISRHGHDPKVRPWQAQVLCAVMGSEISRSPWLVALVDSEASLRDTLAHREAPFHLKIEAAGSAAENAAARIVDDGRPYVQDNETTWYVSAGHTVANSTRLVLLFYATPHHHLSLLPFARDCCTLDSLVHEQLAPHLGGWNLSSLWRPGFDGSTVLETVVSFGETVEQMARRMGEYTHSCFSVMPPAPTRARPPHPPWTMRWAGDLHALGTQHPAEPLLTLADFIFDSEELGWQIQPAARSTVVERPRPGPFARMISHPVRTSTDQDQQAVNVPLATPLEARWSYTTSPVQTAGWAGNSLDTDGGRCVVAALHVIGEREQINACLRTAASHLGQSCPATDVSGYLCLLLSVPPSHSSLPPALLTGLLDRLDVEALARRLADSCQLGTWMLRSPACQVPPGQIQAIVASSPSQNVLDRGNDDRSYQHCIWVTLAGIEGVIRAHWMTPFASRNSEGVGKGDMVFVPETGSTGYVVLTAGQGMPVFVGATHFRNTTTAQALDADDSKHALVTDGGVTFTETSKHMKFDAPLLQNTCQSRLSLIGNIRKEALPSLAELMEMEEIPAACRPATSGNTSQ